MLTILTSPHIEVHDQSMLIPIKTCYNIHISSKSLVNQASARAALTQIINTILQRFDTAYGENQKSLVSQTNKLNMSNNDTISIGSDINDDLYDRYVAIIHERDDFELNENSDDIADLMINMLNTLSKETRKTSEDLVHSIIPNGLSYFFFRGN